MKINTLTRLHTKALWLLEMISKVSERRERRMEDIVKYNHAGNKAWHLFPHYDLSFSNKRLEIDGDIQVRLMLYYRRIVSKIEEIKND